VDVSISGSVGCQCQHTALNSRFHTSVLFVLYSISSFMMSPPTTYLSNHFSISIDIFTEID
jgi:hypothetical protein